jgi:hypothetical protein
VENLAILDPGKTGRDAWFNNDLVDGYNDQSILLIVDKKILSTGTSVIALNLFFIPTLD